MISSTDFENIKKEIKEFFKKTSFNIEVEVGTLQEETIPVNIEMEEPQILIGEGGQTLADIQHLLKAVLKKTVGTEEPFYLDLDINNYKKKKIEYLKETARAIADEVVLLKKEKELPPMPAYERRMIHLELAGRQDVATESVGQGLDRRIIIRPCS